MLLFTAEERGGLENAATSNLGFLWVRRRPLDKQAGMLSGNNGLSTYNFFPFTWIFFFHVDFRIWVWGFFGHYWILNYRDSEFHYSLHVLGKKYWEGLIFPELQVVDTYKKKETLLLCLLACINSLRKCNPSTYLIGSSYFCGLRFLHANKAATVATWASFLQGLGNFGQQNTSNMLSKSCVHFTAS